MSMENGKAIPAAIEKILKASLHRIRRIVAFRGVCATLAVLIASVLAIMAIDAMVTIYSSWVRWLLWSGAIAATGSVAWSALIRPLRKKISLADVALLIERNHPELDERLSTVVELAQEGRAADVWSKELVAEITKGAISDVAKVSPKKEFTTRTVKPRFIAAAAAIFILGVLFAVFPTATARLVARAILPSAEVDNIYASSMQVAPGDAVLLAGSSFKVSLAVDGGFPSKAFVRTSVNGKSEAVERMVRMTEEEAKGPVFYEFDYPSVYESFTYRVNCGSALTKAYNVKVVPEPTFVDRKITIEHPPYTGRLPSTYTNSAQIVGVAGSKITVAVRKAREDLTGLMKVPGGLELEGEPTGQDLLEFYFDLDKEADGMWSLTAFDSNGFSNQVENAAVTVVKDTPPTVELTTPDETEIKLPRTGVLPIAFRARDDFRVERAVLEFAAGAADYTDLKTLDLEKGEEGWVIGSDSISIAALKAKLGNSAAFQVRVRVEDNLPAEYGGPGVTRSASVLVELAVQGQGKSLGRQDLQKQIEETRKEAEDIRRLLQVANQHIEIASRDLGSPNGWSAQNARRCINVAKDNTVNAEGLFADFIQNLLDTRLSTGAAILKPVLEKHIIPVRQEIEDLYLLDEEAKKPAAKKASDHYKDLMKAYDEALKKYNLLTKTAEDMQKLEDLREQQEALAEAAENGEMSAKDLSDAEKQLMDELSRELADDMKVNLDKEMAKVDELVKKIEEFHGLQKEIKERKTGDEQTQEEERLWRDIERILPELARLLQDVESKAGVPEADEGRTAEPLENAKWSVEDARDSAKDATQNLKDQQREEAKAAMDDASESLKQAKEQLLDAKARMEKANERFGKEQEELQKMMDEISEAMQAAMDAAKAELGELDQEFQKALAEAMAEMQKAMEEMQSQLGEQQKLSPEEMKEMLEAMKNMPKMSPEEMKEMMKQMKKALEEMKAQLGSLSKEELKAQMEAAMKDAMEQMKNLDPSAMKPEMKNMMEKMQSAADMMKQQMQRMMEQKGMEMEQFQPPQPEMPQSPMDQMKQQTPQMQQMQQMSQQESKQPPNPNEKHQTSNLREALGDDEGVDWFRMKSASGSGAEADPMDDVPSEYRGLVRDYFKALNEGGK